MAIEAQPATLNVCEIFTSIQGEGTRIGMPSTFVRLLRCNLHCRWCLDEDSLVLMGDLSEKRLGDLEVGDVVMAAGSHGGNQQWTRARVEHVSSGIKPCIELKSDHGSLVLTSDHKLWKAERGKWAEAKDLLGHDVRYLGRPATLNDDYLRGYLAGAADGEGTFWTLNKGNGHYRRFRLATNDVAILERIAEALQALDVAFHWGRHGRTGFSGNYEVSDALYVTRDAQAADLEALVADDHSGRSDWRKGYLAGLFDTDGTSSGGSTLRWTQQKERVRARLKRVLEAHGVSFTEEPEAIRIVGASPVTRFVLGLSPACLRKLEPLLFREATGRARIEEIREVGERRIVTVTTSEGNYVANGFLVKNCDTTYSWKEGEMGEGTPMSPQAILAEVKAPDVVVTGGEPMLQDLEPLLAVMGDRYVTIETNATIFKPYDRVNLWSLSPKLGASGHKPNKRVIGEFLAHYPHKLQLKFVVDGASDLADVKALLTEFPAVAERRVPVVIQPVGRPEQSQAEYLASLRSLVEDLLLADPFWQAYPLRALPQLHRLIWGDQRGI